MSETSSLDISELLEDFVENLERDILGRFIIDKEKLSIANTMFSKIISRFHTDGYGNKSAANLRAYNDTFIDVIAELWFWWMHIDNVEMRDQIDTYRGFRLPIAVDIRLGELELIAAYPDYHDYFAVGLWDIEFIAQCHAGGIDPNLAFTLVEQ